MNVYVDERIFSLQSSGGISRLWRKLLPELKAALPEVSWQRENADLFVSTYYAPSPIPRSLVVCYDFMAERYPAIGRYHVDARAKRSALTQAGAVVSISQATANDCVAYMGIPSTVAYCGGGADYQRPAVQTVVDFTERHAIDRPYVLLVGKRGLYKNAQALYQAWPHWAGAQDHLIIAVGGEAPGLLPAERDFEARYPDTLRHYQLTDDDLASAYAGATALVYPSLYEGFGLPVVEAMSIGCPVICGRVAGVSEVAGDAAIYCDVTLPMTLIDALNTAGQGQARFEAGQRGMKRARAFTWQRMAATVADVIRNM